MIVTMFRRFTILAALSSYSRSVYVSSFVSASGAGGPRRFDSSLNMKQIDSHLHVWASADEASSSFPYAGDDQVPPQSIQDAATPAKLLEKMNEAKVDGALSKCPRLCVSSCTLLYITPLLHRTHNRNYSVVQPINHKFDHSYVSDAMRMYPEKFKGMLLHDPSLSPGLAVSRLEELVLAGFCGVRFNPYLWPEGKLMSEDGGNGLVVYKRCAELKVPVGVMCFKGLGLHLEDIEALISKSPDTTLILDHMGFCKLGDDENFEKLISLARHPNVVVKVSAMFRNTGAEDSYPYEKIREKRFGPLLAAFGAKRLMVGSDFPFVLETEGSYRGAISVVREWVGGSDREAIMGGTAERLFGKWG